MKTLALLVALAAPASAQSLTITPLFGTQCSWGHGYFASPGIVRTGMTLACHYPGTQGFTAVSLSTVSPNLIDIGGLIGIGTMWPDPNPGHPNFQQFEFDVPLALGPVTWYAQTFYYDPALPIGGVGYNPWLAPEVWEFVLQ